MQLNLYEPFEGELVVALRLDEGVLLCNGRDRLGVCIVRHRSRLFDRLGVDRLGCWLERGRSSVLRRIQRAAWTIIVAVDAFAATGLLLLRPAVAPYVALLSTPTGRIGWVQDDPACGNGPTNTRQTGRHSKNIG